MYVYYKSVYLFESNLRLQELIKLIFTIVCLKVFEIIENTADRTFCVIFPPVLLSPNQFYVCEACI